jgi:hypothetical protein
MLEMNEMGDARIVSTHLEISS